VVSFLEQSTEHLLATDFPWGQCHDISRSNVLLVFISVMLSVLSSCV
jgi:hypothetical protein